MRNEPFETAEPSIVVTLFVDVVVICSEALPRLVNVSLPKVRLVVLLPRTIFSTLYSCESSGAVRVRSAPSVNDNVSVPRPPLTVSTPPDTLNSASSATIIISLPAPASILSTPVPPVMLSIPVPPVITSLPPAPRSVSLPPLPVKISAPEPPVSESPKPPPRAVSLRLSLLVTVSTSPLAKVVTFASRDEPSTSKANCVIPAARVTVTSPALLSAPRSVTISFSTLVTDVPKAAVVAVPTPSPTPPTASSSFSI